jgi:hypothetical protein
LYDSQHLVEFYLATEFNCLKSSVSSSSLEAEIRKTRRNENRLLEIGRNPRVIARFREMIETASEFLDYTGEYSTWVGIQPV